MAGMLHHENLMRGADALAKLGAARLTICGCGALGSNLADNLIRQGCLAFRVIDKDRIEEHNIGTQRFGKGEIGRFKAEALRDQLYEATGHEIEAFPKELTQNTAKKFLRDSDLVIDCFDNSASRSLVQAQCRAMRLPLLHAGLYENFGEVVWDEAYQVPRDVDGDVCDYPLARNIIMLTVAVASEAIVDFLASGRQRSFEITLRDLRIQER
jgi:molybdopterin/thiamine biosynthesis adenylyltransferase